MRVEQLCDMRYVRCMATRMHVAIPEQSIIQCYNLTHRYTHVMVPDACNDVAVHI